MSILQSSFDTQGPIITLVTRTHVIDSLDLESLFCAKSRANFPKMWRIATHIDTHTHLPTYAQRMEFGQSAGVEAPQHSTTRENW